MHNLVPSHQATHPRSYTADNDSPLTDRDANTDRYTYPANGQAHPSNTNPIARHRHRVLFWLRLYHHPGSHR